MVVILIFIAILLVVFGQLSMKMGMTGTGQIGIRELLGKDWFQSCLKSLSY